MGVFAACGRRFLVSVFLIALSSLSSLVPPAEGAPRVAQDLPLLVTRGPYLQMGTPHEATVRWRTNLPVVGRVTVTANPALPSTVVEEVGSGTEHEVRLTGLVPATKYFYEIGTAEGRLAGGEDHFFVTAPDPTLPSGAFGPTRIWAIGDSGTADAKAARVYRAYQRYTGDRHTDLWLMLGDNAYPSGTDLEHQRAVFDMYPELLRRTFLWPTIGNHESYTTDRPRPYLQIFSLPTAGEAGGVPSGTELYYSFDHGDIHFVVLDSMLSQRVPDGAGDPPMMAWLKEDLARANKTWLIAYWHHPPYSKGHHDSDNALGGDPELVQMREHYVPVLESFGVDVILSGHSHSYERSYLLAGHYGASTTLNETMILDRGSGRPSGAGAYRKEGEPRTPRDGAVYVVAGSSGVLGSISTRHPAMYIGLLELGSVVIDIEGTRLRSVFLRDNGEVEDEFVLEKARPAPARPAPPDGPPPPPGNSGVSGPAPTPAPAPVAVATGGGGCRCDLGEKRGPDALASAGVLLLVVVALRRRRRLSLGLAALGMLLAAGSARAHGPLDVRLAAVDAAIAAASGAQVRDLALERVDLLRRLGRHQEALAALPALEDPRDEGLVDRAAARVLVDAKNPAAALARLDRALARADGPAVRRERALVLLALGQPAAAARDLAAAVRGFGRDAEPDEHLLLVRTLRAAGDPVRARRALARAQAQRGPLVVFELEAVELAVETGRFDEALARIEGQLGAGGQEVWLARRAAVLDRAGRKREAREAYQRLREALAVLPPGRRRLPAMSALDEEAMVALASPSP